MMIKDLDIHALIDNELDEARRSEVVARIKKDDSLQERYQNLSEQKALLKMWWALTK